MKKISRLLALLMALAMAVSLAACSNDSGDVSAPASQPADDTSASPSTDGQTYTVGIIQQMQHVALDSATQGFQDALTELLGDAVTIDYKNASGETANCTTIVGDFVASNVDLIMANGTTALQSAMAATSSIPILGTSAGRHAPGVVPRRPDCGPALLLC